MDELLKLVVDRVNELVVFSHLLIFPEIKVKLLDTDAKMPEKNNPSDSGFDLFSTQDRLLQYGDRALVSTGIAVELPEGYELQIRPRSGRAINDGLTVLNSPGTVDQGFTGEVKVILINLGIDTIEIKKGDKIAQAVPSFIPKAKLTIVENLKETDRSDKGFGSSGN